MGRASANRLVRVYMGADTIPVGLIGSGGRSIGKTISHIGVIAGGEGVVTGGKRSAQN